MEPNKYHKSVGIVILNFNGAADTIECTSAALQFVERETIVLIDNCSTDNSMDTLISAFAFKPIKHKEFENLYQSTNFKDLFLIKSFNNKGFAYGNNLGAKFLLSETPVNRIWLLNNDTLPHESAISHMCDLLSEKVGLVGSYQYYMSDPQKIQAIGGGVDLSKGIFWNYQDAKEHENIAFPYGASMLFSRQCLEKVGLLEERFFLYYEEIEYVTRMKKYGYSFKVAKKAKVLHKHGGSISKEGSNFKLYYLARNKIIFYRLHYPQQTAVVIRTILKKCVRDSIFQKRFYWIYLKAIKQALKFDVKNPALQP